MIDPYVYVVIVSALALLAYYFTLLMAGLARGRFKIAVPSHSGPRNTSATSARIRTRWSIWCCSCPACGCSPMS